MNTKTTTAESAPLSNQSISSMGILCSLNREIGHIAETTSTTTSTPTAILQINSRGSRNSRALLAAALKSFAKREIRMRKTDKQKELREANEETKVYVIKSSKNDALYYINSRFYGEHEIGYICTLCVRVNFSRERAFSKNRYFCENKIIKDILAKVELR